MDVTQSSQDRDMTTSCLLVVLAALALQVTFSENIVKFYFLLRLTNENLLFFQLAGGEIMELDVDEMTGDYLDRSVSSSFQNMLNLSKVLTK